MSAQFAPFLAGKGLSLRRLDDEHYTDFFDCGHDEAMSSWFCNTARNWQAEDMCAVWVLSPADNESDPLGFFTLSAHQIIPGNIARNDKATDPENRRWANNLRQPYPAQLLGKFALDRSQHGKGLGKMLMLSVYAKHLEAADAAGAKYLVLDAREDRLVRYYTDEYGFVRSGFAGEVAQMYRPTAIIREELRLTCE
ncbi:N-acetyltransferase [Microbacterium maritypicum]|uniref:N-acetyltransferase domain-containing protein n=1 Tax=Microbacterium maritypicum MF109 TaxID=1333857 RepID=T5KS86_MICMQ|nr:N-acetyltransferase [Microbacterium liquefaciens]EQM81876.1 hypothetical protein L687_00525 [Microbacterium maritypicum MF109]